VPQFCKSANAKCAVVRTFHALTSRQAASPTSWRASMGDNELPPMRSPVNWALLGLIIEREGYALQLARRFEATYALVLPLSSTSHIYTALNVLQDRSYVEPLPETRAGRQPRPTYRATAIGMERYGDWLIGHAGEERRRSVLFILGLSHLAANAGLATEILDRYEHEWRAAGNAGNLLNVAGLPDASARALVPGAVTAKHALDSTAELAWVEQTRRILDEIIDQVGL